MGLGIIIKKDKQVDMNLSQMVGSVEVYEKIDQATTYKIRFMIDICDEDIAENVKGPFEPHANLSIWAEVEDQLVCLVSGPVTKQEAHLEHGGAGSWLDVEGADVSQELTEKVNKGVYHNITDAEVVTKILNNHGITPDVDPTPNSKHLEENNSQAQREYDLSFIRRLAERNGFHFWVSFDDQEKATGHFKERLLDKEPAAKMLVNLGKNNIDNLRLNWDINRPTELNGSQVNQRTNQVMNGQARLDNITKLGAYGLKEILGSNVQTMEISMPVDSAGALETRLRAALLKAHWFINATCRTSLNRLCQLVFVHTIVDIQGAGSRHSGKYYVTGVKHTIDSVAHIMDLELQRNAWGTDKTGLNTLSKKIF